MTEDNTPQIQLIQILRDHINGTPTSPFTTEWPTLFTLANKHQVTAIVYSQCKDFIPEPFQAELQRNHAMVVYYYANRVKALEEIENAINTTNSATTADSVSVREGETGDAGECGDYFIIKGSKIAKYYPEPAYRTMGDTDIVVKDREPVHEKLLSLGFTPISHFSDREWQYMYNGMEFELHDRLVYSEAVNEDQMVEFLNYFWPYVRDGELDWSFHYIFLIFHLRKHFMNAGVGIRYFMDIAVLCKASDSNDDPQFDWAWIEGKLKDLNLWEFTRRVFALNEYWFGVEAPVSVGAFSLDFFTTATDLIMKNGIFGFHNEENASAAVVNKARREMREKGRTGSRGGLGRFLSMLKDALKKIFPSYKALIAVPKYSFVIGRPYLLPYVWIKRAVQGVMKGGMDEGVKFVSSSFASKEDFDKREAVLKQWGL